MNKLVVLLAGVLISAPIIVKENVLEKKSNLTCSKWEEVKNTDGVKTFVRWHYYNDGSKTRERKGEIQVDCNLKKTIEIITDVSAVKYWMSGVSDNYLISQADKTKWYTYTLYNIPWPFESRDLVSLYELKNEPGCKSVTISIHSKADYIPQKPGIERLKNYVAVWTINETKPQQVQIVFSAMSNVPPLFSRYIQDPVVEKMFHSNLVRLKELLSASTCY